MARLRPFYQLKPSEWVVSSTPEIQNAKTEVPSNQSAKPKELVRQWILKELVSSYAYPKDWLRSRISLVGASEGDFFGFSIQTATGVPFLWLSVADVGYADTADELLQAKLLKEEFSGVGICTDGVRTKFLRRRFDSAKCEYITDIEPFAAPPDLFGWQPFVQGEDGRILVPLSGKAEGVFFEIHSYIRDIDGLHADEALDELCKLIYCKLYDEESTVLGQALRMQRGIYRCTEELAASVRELYWEASQKESRMPSGTVPGHFGVFRTPIRLSSPALAKAVEAFQAHSLLRTDTDIKGRAFQRVISPTIRAGMGQYFTPDIVIRFMTKVMNPTMSDKVLDPFCGSAHFLLACLDLVGKNSTVSDRELAQYAYHNLHGIEKSDRMVRVAMTDMRLHGDGHSNIRCADALLEFSNYPDLAPEAFDVILTNPPFGSILGREAISQLGKFHLAGVRRSVPLEVIGLERCLQLLKAGGRLGIVLPDGVLANQSSRYIREWLDTQGKIRGIISLPVETFFPFGANVKTSLLFVRRWLPGERTWDYPVFISRVDNIGYDGTGRQKDGCELDEVLDRFREFLAKEGW